MDTKLSLSGEIIWIQLIRVSKQAHCIQESNTTAISKFHQTLGSFDS